MLTQTPFSTSSVGPHNAATRFAAMASAMSALNVAVVVPGGEEARKAPRLAAEAASNVADGRCSYLCAISDAGTVPAAPRPRSRGVVVPVVLAISLEVVAAEAGDLAAKS